MPCDQISGEVVICSGMFACDTVKTVNTNGLLRFINVDNSRSFLMGGGPGLSTTQRMHNVSLETSCTNVPFIVLRRGGAKDIWSRTMVHFVFGSELEEVDPGSV